MTEPVESRQERKRRLARERQRAKRKRDKTGARVLFVPGTIADEIADDEDFSTRALEILTASINRRLA